MVLIIGSSQLRSALRMADVIKAVEEGFKEFSSKRAVMPPRCRIDVEGGAGAFLFMPAYLPRAGAIAVKEVSVHSGNRQARGLPTVRGVVILSDPKDGSPLAIIEGAALTAIRTGAAGAIAAKYLSNKDAEAVAIFGAGIQGRAQLEGLAEVRGIRKAWIVDPAEAAAKSLAEYAARTLGVDAEVCSDAEGACRRAGIIVTATTSRVPVIYGKWLDGGVHINGIGSHDPQSREIDSEAVLIAAREGKVVVDSYEACLSEAGDIIIPIKEGAIARADLHAEIGEVAAGAKRGRESELEVTLFKSVGISVQDAAAAMAAYQSVLRSGAGVEVELEDKVVI
uniref:Ornithine cyclodeaminase family protein n=1 Tax=Candidatus Methanomethylicus mesodigestus TaxID=1867258 RepID=A0A7C3J2C1_9CREN